MYRFTVAKFSRYKQSTKFNIISENTPDENRRLNSLPAYYAYSSLLYSIVPALLLTFVLFLLAQKTSSTTIESTILGSFFIISLTVFAVAAYFYIKPKFKARERIESFIKMKFIFATLIAVSITLLIILSVFYESIRFFEKSS
ncbi:MAG TPA: hypothetical protein DIV86_03525, partial [Alphaproteobacteria bacterium]|nr:hypothetical protein [Alphaproteobacteria bacterium]